MNIVISDLRHRPEFINAIANRVWETWWKERSYPIEHITNLVHENLNAESIPFALVAHDGPIFLGTASVIVSDISERPLYTPWIAALWVDPEYRQQGIGAALVEQAVKSIFNLGLRASYLCATRERRNFYLKRGWSQIEEDVGEKLLTIMIRDSISDS